MDELVLGTSADTATHTHHALSSQQLRPLFYQCVCGLANCLVLCIEEAALVCTQGMQLLFLLHASYEHARTPNNTPCGSAARRTTMGLR